MRIFSEWFDWDGQKILIEWRLREDGGVEDFTIYTGDRFNAYPISGGNFLIDAEFEKILVRQLSLERRPDLKLEKFTKCLWVSEDGHYFIEVQESMVVGATGELTFRIETKNGLQKEYVGTFELAFDNFMDDRDTCPRVCWTCKYKGNHNAGRFGMRCLNEESPHRFVTPFETCQKHELYTHYSSFKYRPRPVAEEEE